jgi:hypothetical protein
MDHLFRYISLYHVTRAVRWIPLSVKGKATVGDRTTEKLYPRFEVYNFTILSRMATVEDNTLVEIIPEIPIIHVIQSLLFHYFFP